MKIVISPAKKLAPNNNDFDNKETSNIQFLDEATYLVEQLRQYTANDIGELMKLSNDLANLNYKRYQNWDLYSEEVAPAIFMFQGDVYKGLRANELSNKDLDFTQENLRIISGLYGLLKPLDRIFPYRLEMGTKITTEAGNNLYDFWHDKLHKALSSQMEAGEVLVNLASNEYSKALILKKLKNKIVTPVFKDYKNGKLKVISFFAKKARGEMVNFIVKNKITDSQDLKLFNQDGYKFASESDNELVFTR